MGSYSSLIINEKSIASSKNGFDWYVDLIFDVEDIKVSEMDISAMYDGLATEPEYRECRFLVASATKIIERLTVLGYTDSLMYSDFDDFKKQKIDGLKDSKLNGLSFDEEFTNTEIQFWESHNLDDFLKGIYDYLASKSRTEIQFGNSFNSIDNYLGHQNYDLLYSLPFVDGTYALRAVLRSIPGSILIKQEYTDLYDGGWVDDETLFDTTSKEKIIILTEGASDISILKPSLHALYPHLSSFYSFFDFDAFNSQGSAGHLVNIIKAFASAGIRNKIIALFDNDTAAREAQDTLKNLNLPNHIRHLNLPHLKLAEHYPSVGPSGLNYMNINGLACSIELYLGEDVLKKDQKEFFPVQWKGYSSKVDAYQGEITNKKDIHLRFENKLKYFIKHSTNSEHQDWTGLQTIFETIFDCFNKEKNTFTSLATNKGIPL